MNKTVNINLAGIFFHIDEDAYLKLSRYLEAIKRSFTDSQGRSEIIADIEARIAELFSERIQNEKQVVGIKLVDEVITIMGQPEDYLVDDEIFEDEPQYQQRRTYKSGPTKKLYRDTDNSYIGGVSAGLSHYLGIDMVWVRLLWILFTFLSGGSFIIIYLLFWALVPEAKTTAEKLTMTGEPVNISNIEKKIKDGIDTVTEKVKNVDFKKHGESIKEGFENVADNISESVKNVDFEKQGNHIRTKSRNFFETIGDILMFFLKVFAKFFGVVLIITGISALLVLIVAYFSVGVANVVNFPGVDFFELANVANVPKWMMATSILLAFGIPFFFIFYIGLKILINNLKSIGNVAKFTLLGLWILSIIGLSVIGVRQATEFSYNAYDTSNAVLPIKATDTLKIKMVDNTIIKNRPYINNGRTKVYRSKNGKKIIADRDVKFIVRSTKDSIAKIEVSKKAHGNSYDNATERAENIQYNYKLNNNVLELDRYLTTDASNKFSDQSVQLIIYLPEGTTLYADDNTYRYHRNSPAYNDILNNGMEEEYLIIAEDDVICTTCDDDDNNDDDDGKNGIQIDKDGIKIKADANVVNIDSEGMKANSKEVNVNIGEDGIEITTEKDND